MIARILAPHLTKWSSSWTSVDHKETKSTSSSGRASQKTQPHGSREPTSIIALQCCVHSGQGANVNAARQHPPSPPVSSDFLAGSSGHRQYFYRRRIWCTLREQARQGNCAWLLSMHELRRALCAFKSGCLQTELDREVPPRSMSKQIPKDHASCNEPTGPLATRAEPRVPRGCVDRWVMLREVRV